MIINQRQLGNIGVALPSRADRMNRAQTVTAAEQMVFSVSTTRASTFFGHRSADLCERNVPLARLPCAPARETVVNPGHLLRCDLRVLRVVRENAADPFW
jgi:hypothetical protein